jgi:hypothetical protein
VRIFALILLLCLMYPLTSQATLVGDSIHGEINFAITGTDNFLDPVFGHVPSPNSGIQPWASVTDLDGSYFEFEYTNGPAGRVNLDIDVDATTITIREFLISALEPADPVHGWDLWLSDLEFGGPGGVIPGVAILSTNFAGLSVSHTDHEIHVSYAGGQGIASLDDTLFANIIITPEPGTALLLGLGLAALSRRGRARSAAPGSV